MNKVLGRRITVKVIPKAGRNAIEEISLDKYVVHITTVPERGRANEAVVKILARHLKIAPSLLQIVSGGKSRNKVFVTR